MQTIELECPTCKSVLELDAGFAGGVCRCSSCGTLMTVPGGLKTATTRSNRPDRPDRPGRPAAPGASSSGRPAAPVSPTPSEEPEAELEAEVEAEAEANPETEALAATVSAGPIRAEAVVASSDGKTFRTTSGRIIRLAANRVVPTAKAKRKAVRYGIIVTFVVVMTALIVGTVIAVIVVGKTSQGPVAPTVLNPDAIKEVLKFDPDANPFLSETPNVLGVPLGANAIVVIDASSYSSTWISLAKDAVVEGFKNAGGSAKLQVVVISEQGMKMFPEKPGPVVGREKEMFDFLDAIPTSGVARLDGVILNSLESKADQIVLITAQPLLPLQISELGEHFENYKKVRFDVVAISQDLPEIESVTARQNGLYTSIPESRMISWYRAFRDREAGANP